MGELRKHILPSRQPSRALGGIDAPQPPHGPALHSPGPPRYNAAAAVWGDGGAPPAIWGGTLSEGAGHPRGSGRSHSRRGGNGLLCTRRGRGWAGFPPLLHPPWASPGCGGVFGGLFPSVFSCPSAMPASEAVPQPSPSKRQKGSGPGEASTRLRFTKLSENAFAPSRGSARSAGYDLYR